MKRNVLWVYGHYKYVYSYSAGLDFSRQNLTSTDVRFWRLKSVPALKELKQDKCYTVIGYPICYPLRNTVDLVIFACLKLPLGMRIFNFVNFESLIYLKLYNLLILNQI